MRGVTRLRVEGNDGDAGWNHQYRPETEVLLDNTDEVRLTVRARKIEAQDPTASGARARLTATRENDTLVLRWTHPPGGPQPAQPPWVSAIELPARFGELTLEHASIKARSALARLQVSGRAIDVEGPIAALDLRSTQCQRPCKKQAPAAGGRRAPGMRRPGGLEYACFTVD